MSLWLCAFEQAGPYYSSSAYPGSPTLGSTRLLAFPSSPPPMVQTVIVQAPPVVQTVVSIYSCPLFELFAYPSLLREIGRSRAKFHLLQIQISGLTDIFFLAILTVKVYIV
jgi:hypothetical protein